MMRRNAVGVVSCLLVLAWSPPHAAAFTYSSSIDDSYIRGSSPTANDGSENILRVRMNGPARALVRFDPAAIAADCAGGVVQSATLTLYAESTSQFPTGALIDVHRVTRSWEEEVVTWNLAAASVSWTAGGGDFVSTPTTSYTPTNGVVTPINLDVTADVSSFCSGTNNYGWLLKKRVESQAGGTVYTSQQGAITANHPKLVVVVNFPSGTATPTKTPPPGLTSTPTASPTLGLSESCSNDSTDNPKACDKISTFPLRSLRDWAACLDRNAPSTWGITAGVGCGVFLADGGEGTNDCHLQSPSFVEEPELQCAEAAANCELERDLHHCDYKLLYQDECTPADWAVVEQYLTGSLPSSPSDVVKYPGDAWYPCIPWQRDTIYKTIKDVWLPFLAKRVVCNGGSAVGLSCMAGEACPGGTCVSALASGCAHQALAAMAGTLDEFIYQAGDDNTAEDKKAFWRCETAFSNTAVKNNCDTCDRSDGSPELGYNSTETCPLNNEQITAAQWDGLCQFLKAQYNPFRQACREKAGNTASGPGWTLAPTPAAIP